MATEPTPEAQQIAARSDATGSLIAAVRDEARHKLREVHLQELTSVQNQGDLVGNAFHSNWHDRLDPETPDDAETIARLDAETVRLLRDAAINHADPVIQRRAVDALHRLRVPVTDPELAAKAAARERDRERERWAAKVWRSFNSPNSYAADSQPRPVAPTLSKAAQFATELKAKRARLKAMADDPTIPFDIRASARRSLETN